MGLKLRPNDRLHNTLDSGLSFKAKKQRMTEQSSVVGRLFVSLDWVIKGRLVDAAVSLRGRYYKGYYSTAKLVRIGSV